MGWTGHPNMSVKEAIAYELRNHTIVGGPTRYDGATWVLITTDTGPLLVAFLTERHGNEAFLKDVTPDMGPFNMAPKALFHRYITERPDTSSPIERDWRAAVDAHHNSATPHTARLNPGDTITFEYPFTFADGITEQTFTFVRQYTFTRASDSGRVRLPRTWRHRGQWTLTRAA